MPETIKLTVTEAPGTFASQGFTHCVKNEETGNIVALFESYSEATDYRYRKVQTAEEALSSALSVVRQDYYQDVRDTAESIKSELMDRVKDQECGDSLREWLQEHIHETIDGSSRVIYTQSAMLGLFASDNDGSYFEQFGDEGVVEDGSINWSRLCFSAFETDVIEQLGSIGVDVNEPLPACEDCGEEDQDSERYIVGDSEDCLCESCKEEREEKEEDEEEDDTDEGDQDQDGGIAGADSRQGD